MTEQEWLAKEKKEIEEVEKTVNIRFANYSTLMRAQSLTQGLSAQLAMFLSTMGVNNQQAGTTAEAKTTSILPAVTQTTQATAGKTEEPEKDKLRSLSPLGMLENTANQAEERVLERRSSQGRIVTQDAGKEADK